MKKYSPKARNYRRKSTAYNSFQTRKPARGTVGAAKSSGGGFRFEWNKKNIAVVAGIAAAVVILIICLVLNTGSTIPEGTFAKNVTIQGVSVGGMTTEEAQEALQTTMDEMQQAAVLKLEVPVGDNQIAVTDLSADETEEEQQVTDLSADTEDETANQSGTAQTQIVEYPAEKSGLYMDFQKAAEDALAYTDTVKHKNQDKLDPVDFPLAYNVDDAVLQASLQTDAANWEVEAKGVSFALETSSNEEDMTTSATPTKQEAQDGVAVDTQSFAQTIRQQVVELQDIDTAIAAPTIVTKTEGQSAEAVEYEVIGEYSTDFATSTLSKPNRMYNIWKISSILNGTRIPAGENMSVNDIVGDRTEARGWKPASGIENGQYKDQAGGGICQVSSTLYIAALKAELKIIDRTHHTIPSSYVPLGLDATISTGSPDLVLENNTDYPMYIGITCDVPERTVRVRIYGVKPRDYTLRFESQVIETLPAIETQYVADSTVPENETVEEGSSRDGYKVEVYKVWYDKETGEETDRKRIYTDTYKAMGMTVKYNPNTPPAAIATPTPEPTATPTPAPTATPAPTVTPTPAPPTETATEGT